MHWKTPVLWIFSAICPRLDSNFSNCDIYVLAINDLRKRISLFTLLVVQH